MPFRRSSRHSAKPEARPHRSSLANHLPRYLGHARLDRTGAEVAFERWALPVLLAALALCWLASIAASDLRRVSDAPLSAETVEVAR